MYIANYLVENYDKDNRVSLLTKASLLSDSQLKFCVDLYNIITGDKPPERSGVCFCPICQP